MEINYTKGEWIVSNQGNDRIFVLGSSCSDAILRVYTKNGSVENKEQAIANANLAAAAPELLDMLIKIREYYVYGKKLEEYEYEKLLDGLDSLIEKATKGYVK